MVSWKNDATLIRQMDDLSSLLLLSGYFSSFINIWMVDDCLARAPPHHFVKAIFFLLSMYVMLFMNRILTLDILFAECIAALNGVAFIVGLSGGSAIFADYYCYLCKHC